MRAALGARHYDNLTRRQQLYSRAKLRANCKRQLSTVAADQPPAQLETSRPQTPLIHPDARFWSSLWLLGPIKAPSNPPLSRAGLWSLAGSGCPGVPTRRRPTQARCGLGRLTVAAMAPSDFFSSSRDFLSWPGLLFAGRRPLDGPSTGPGGEIK